MMGDYVEVRPHDTMGVALLTLSYNKRVSQALRQAW